MPKNKHKKCVGIKIEIWRSVKRQYKILVKIRNQQNTLWSRLRKRASLANRASVDNPDLK